MRYLFIFISCLLLNSCGTVSPNFVQPKEIAFGTNGIQDAGVHGQVFNPKTSVHYIILQASDRDEFNNDVIKYGYLFNPPLIKDFGIIPYKNEYAFRNDALTDFIVMKKFAARDLAPK